MADLVQFWCQLFGYADCHALSTFEAILLAGAAFLALLIAVPVLFALFTGMLATLALPFAMIGVIIQAIFQRLFNTSKKRLWLALSIPWIVGILGAVGSIAGLINAFMNPPPDLQSALLTAAAIGMGAALFGMAIVLTRIAHRLGPPEED
jgi:hypothetical protein